MDNNLFRNKYNTKTIRMHGWNYCDDAIYFLTFCAQNKGNIFGEIKNRKMILNKIGFIVKNEWLRSVLIRREISLDCFAIMPDHFHAIVGIAGGGASDVEKTKYIASLMDDGRGMYVASDGASKMDVKNRTYVASDVEKTKYIASLTDGGNRTYVPLVETNGRSSLPQNVFTAQYVNPPQNVHTHIPQNASPARPFRMKPQSISSLVAGFKSATTSIINKKYYYPGFRIWQRDYYDVVIRSQRQLNRTRQYIINNPKKYNL